MVVRATRLKVHTFAGQKQYLYFSVIFKTLTIILLAPGIETVNSHSTAKDSTGLFSNRSDAASATAIAEIDLITNSKLVSISLDLSE